MPTIDNRTDNFDLPLPHVDNLLADDVERLRDCFEILDEQVAPLNSPTLTGGPTAPTPASGDNSDLVATTAFVHDAVTPKAPLNSPVFTGTPTVPTQAAGNNSNAIANTQFVRNEIAAIVGSSPAALDTLNELAGALGNDPNFATTVTDSLASKAPLDSPVFTGNPRAPSPGLLDDDTSIATTEWVNDTIGYEGTLTLTGAQLPAGKSGIVQYIKQGKMVSVNFSIEVTDNTMPLFTMPSGYRPGGINCRASCAWYTNSSTPAEGVAIYVSTGGAVNLLSQAKTSGIYIGNFTIIIPG
jgi:hypothetical protein